MTQSRPPGLSLSIAAPSASGIRRELLSRRDNRGYASGAFCMSPDDFSAQLEAVLFELLSAIRSGYNTSLTDYLDVTPDTGNRIRRCKKKSSSPRKRWRIFLISCVHR